MMEAVPRIEHAVIISLRLDAEAATRVDDLVIDLGERLAGIEGGECGGSDQRDEYCLVYCYGADASDIFDAISPAIDQFGPLAGSWAIKRFGAAEDIQARRERVDL